jgi:hypothetical protein
LPILILADGLYPYEGFFAICKANQWHYIVTFKEGNLPTIWRDVEEMQALQVDNQHREKILKANKNTEERDYRWVTNLDYQGYSLNWLECRETTSQTNKKAESEQVKCIFTHITDITLNSRNIVSTSQTGRLRWKIENEGFNTLKNGGYELEHKYSRVSYQATKNYFQLMQMAYLINQLMVKSTRFQDIFFKAKNPPTLKSLWQDLIAAMKWAELNIDRLKAMSVQKIQFRFVT